MANKGFKLGIAVEIINHIRATFEEFPDYRKPGNNRKYAIKDKGSRYFCERLFWASQPKQSAKT